MNLPSMVRLANSPRLQALRPLITRQSILEWAIKIQQIPAPTFHEGQRAAFVQQSLVDLACPRLETDGLGNVLAWPVYAGPNCPTLLISAHTDTVFPEETDLSLRYEGDKIYGPGLGDNSLGVAALLGLARALPHAELPPKVNICLTANTCEEGLGDLKGINRVLDSLGNLVKAGIVIEGMALGRVYNAGIAVERYKISVQGPGGHSWLHFGKSSAIHSLMRFGADLSRLSVPYDPPTTYNIGLIGGGSSINSLAAEAYCYLDLRSSDPQALEALLGQVKNLVALHSSNDIMFTLEQVGRRPAGAISAGHPMVVLASQACRAINLTPMIENGSTDTNALLARGVPAVCVGVSYGANAHSLEEYIETQAIESGMWHLLMLSVAATQWMDGGISNP